MPGRALEQEEEQSTSSSYSEGPKSWAETGAGLLQGQGPSAWSDAGESSTGQGSKSWAEAGAGPLHGQGAGSSARVYKEGPHLSQAFRRRSRKSAAAQVPAPPGCQQGAPGLRSLVGRGGSGTGLVGRRSSSAVDLCSLALPPISHPGNLSVSVFVSVALLLVPVELSLAFALDHCRIYVCRQALSMIV